MRSWSQSSDDFNASSVDFLNIEVQTGLLFADIALASCDDAKTARNRSNARLAYDTVLRFMDRVVLTKAESRELQGKMAKLKVQLQTLGDSF